MDIQTVSISEAGLMLGVSHHTVKKWCNAGLMPCRRFPGGRLRVLRSDVQHFFSSLPKLEIWESSEVPKAAP